VIVSAEQRRAARDVARRHRRGRFFLREADLDTISEVVANEFQTETERVGNKSASRDSIKSRAQANSRIQAIKPKSFLTPTFLLTVVIGWVISQVLSYFWDQLAKQQLKDNGWPAGPD
jgi:hypothetical protein